MRGIHHSLQGVPVWASLGLIILAVMLPSRGANVILLDADPFSHPYAQVLGDETVPDWTSLPDPLPGPLVVSAETFDAASGLIQPTRRVLGTVPDGVRYLLVNQIEPDVAFFDYSAAAPGTMVDIDRNGLLDFWEYHYFARLGVDPETDEDGDGFTQQAESSAGTDPLNRDSKPEIPGLVAFWRGEEDSQDATGAHDGTWSGPVRYAKGRLGSAFDLRGDNYVRVSGDSALRPDGGFTIAAWVKLSEVSGNPNPLLTYPSTSPGASPQHNRFATLSRPPIPPSATSWIVRRRSRRR